MNKQKPSEAILSRKILLLRQKFRQQKKEERIYMMRNKKLAHEIQSHKEALKSLNDQRLALQKQFYDEKYAKSVSEKNNVAYNSRLSRFLNEFHAFQTEVINRWREDQNKRNRHSSKKPEESNRHLSMDEQTISAGELGKQNSKESEEASTEQEEPSVLSSVLTCRVEALNTLEVKPVLTSHIDISDSKQELSSFLNSFCRRDTVPVERTSEADFQQSKNVPLDRTSAPEYGQSENVLLEKTSDQEYQQSESVLLERTSERESQHSEIVPLESTVESSSLRLENETERVSPLGEPFQGFAEDQKTKTKFTDMIERLSIKCENLDTLRNYEIAQSLTVFESTPDVTAREDTTTTLEVDWSKQYKLQDLEVSIPRLDMLTIMSLDSTIEISKQDRSRGRNSRKSTQDKEPKNREETNDSTSESLNNGRAVRRARNKVVSYKEKPLSTKLRRS